jgi:hypothetical protein
MKQRVRMVFLSLAIAGASSQAAEGEQVSTLQDQQQVAVTIYNQDFAMIKDVRRVDLVAGDNALAWRDVSARMHPETALLRSASDPKGFHLIEQNFDFDLLTPQKLIEKYVGRKVQVIKTNPASGVETFEDATVLSANDGIVAQFTDRIESHPPGRLAFKALPDNLRDRPTLVVRLQTATAGPQNLELAYLSGGLAWKADYVAELSEKDDRADLNGWVTLRNQSGATYRNARLQLVAGDVNRVQEEPLQMNEAALQMEGNSEEAPMKQEGLFEYHLYTLDRPTTIAENQNKQVALLSASDVAARKEFVLQGADSYYRLSAGDIGQKLKVGVFVEIDNKAPWLGIPLPRGVVRVYKKDSAGHVQFVGEDRIDHTPKGETVHLKLGDAFDVTADKKQTDFQKLEASGRYDYVYEEAFEILVKNAKSEAVTVKVVEPIPGDWEMLSESLKHAKAAANTAVWNVPVPADSQTALSYRVRVRY